MNVARYLPILDWGRRYTRAQFVDDGMAAVIVTIMLIPQSLAYAMLAGLPPEVGLYASILPLVAYALLGTSPSLAVGPVAVISLMTLAAASAVAPPGTPAFIGAAVVLAMLSGLILLAMGVARLGFVANYLSHPVVSGFITASGLLIAAGQLKHLLGISAQGETWTTLLPALVAGLPETNPITLSLGVAVTAFLFWSRRGLKPLLRARGMGARTADMLTKAAPVAAVAVTTLLAWWFNLGAAGVKLVGQVPSGLPVLALPPFDLALWSQLLMSALLLSVVGFVESVSVAQTLAARRRLRIRPDQELLALGGANLASAVSGGYPVTGGFARSVVNDDAGAATPMAGALTAVGIALATLLLTPLLAYLPVATLAATIIVAVLSLVDLPALGRVWRYSRADGAAMGATIGLTLLAGVETGIISGVLLSVLLHLHRSATPHVAEVGLVPGTQHFRNINRHAVETKPHLLMLRVDESLYFANAAWLEEMILARLADRPALRHVVLMCSAVNFIDSSALESLETINRRLRDLGIGFHLTEVKGPVMDRLKRSHLLTELNGQVFLSQYEAWVALSAES